MSTVDIDTVADRVRRHLPNAAVECWAATALILGEGRTGPEVLMIRRLAREGDRWSGDMALPGGKVDPEDASPEAAAARESLEEVGVVVGPLIGRLDDVQGGPLSHRVATAVFSVDGLPPLVPEPGEVAQAMWLPLMALTDPASRTWHRYGGVVPFRSITVGDAMIWGLTHRILTNFFAVAGLD